jgi:hypothetical protein
MQYYTKLDIIIEWWLFPTIYPLGTYFLPIPDGERFVLEKVLFSFHTRPAKPK